MLKIGELDRRITIQAPTWTQNNYGEATQIDWDSEYTVWAKVDWKKSNTREESEQITEVSDLTFYIRNIGVDILGTYRIVFDSKNYYIHGIKEVDGRDQFLEIETKVKDNED